MKTKTKGLDLRVGGSYASYLELVLLERTLATFTKLLQTCVMKTKTKEPDLRVGGSYASYLELVCVPKVDLQPGGVRVAIE